MVAINARDPTLFTAAAQCHPASLDPCDAATVSIPMCILASGDEDQVDVQRYASVLTGEKHIETFGDMPHGWMSAKGDLDNERNKSEYERGYQILIEFFSRYLYGKGERRPEEIISTRPFAIGCDI